MRNLEIYAVLLVNRYRCSGRL